MEKTDRDFISSCNALGGKLLKEEDKVICDFADGGLGLITYPNRDDFVVVDNRMRPHGKNVTKMSNIDFIGSDNRDMFVKSGSSHLRVGRDNHDVKVYTELKPEPLYGEETGMLSLSPAKREGCPTGMRQDKRSGECVPDIKYKPDRPSTRTSEPSYSSISWFESKDVPFILINDSHSIAKATINTWVNSKEATPISREFLSCQKPANINLEVGREYKKKDQFGRIDKTVKIGNSYYDRNDLYRVAEEIFRVKIMDPVADRPMRSELGAPLQLKALLSDRPDHPLAIRGDNKIYYLVNSIGGN